MISLLWCKNCRRWKSHDLFNRMVKSPTGFQYECRSCASVRNARRYAGLSVEQRREKQVAQRAHRAANPSLYYWVRIRSVYGLTRERFEKIFAGQGHACGICRAEEPGGRYGQWVVDHDHACCSGLKSCGRCVRGLLCNACNHGLGNFADRPTVLRAAAAYLEKGIPHD